MNRYQDIIGRVNQWLFLVVVAMLPFPQIALRTACVLWVVSWYMEGRWLHKSNLQSPISNLKLSLPFLLFGLWYAVHAISGLWAADTALWAMQMERYLAFGLLVPIGLWGLNKHYDAERTLRVFAIAAWIAVPFYAVWFVWRWHGQITDLEFVAANISHLKHRLFLCSVELLGMIAAVHVWRQRPVVLTCALLSMGSLVLISGSRQALLTAAVLGVCLLLWLLPTHLRKRYGVAVVLLGLLVGGGVIGLHPRMQEFGLNGLTHMREMSYNHDLRLNIWGAALQHPQDYLAFGLGGGQSPDYLAQRYAEAGFDYYAESRFHAHNQYLEELMETGVPGLSLFLLAWLSVPLCAQKKGRPTAILLTLLFALNMCTDCMFGSFCGVALWAVGLLLILLQSDSQREQ